MKKDKLKKNNEELKHKILSDMMNIRSIDGDTPYFSIEWIKEKLLGIDAKYEKRKNIIEKLLKNK